MEPELPRVHPQNPSNAPPAGAELSAGAIFSANGFISADRLDYAR
jgi:hypothetical protein